MDVLEAHYHFCNLPTDQQIDLMPPDANTSAADGRELVEAFPLWLTAGALLSGMLDDCHNVNDLLEAFKHFVMLWDSETFSGEQWTVAANEVLGALEADSIRFAMALGNKLERNASFSQAELN